MKRYGKLAAFCLAVVTLTAFDHAAMAYINIYRMGPFWTTSASYDTLNGNMIGGEVRFFRDSTDTLLVGDVVYLSRSNTVHKSTTLANYTTIAGVVVGGSYKGMRLANAATNVGDTATLAHGTVIVLVRGRTWVKPDTGLSPGAQLLPSTATAGQAHARIAAALIDTFYRAYGRMIDSGISGTASLASISIRY